MSRLRFLTALGKVPAMRSHLFSRMSSLYCLPSGNVLQFAIENSPVEIVEIYPARKWVDFPVRYVKVYQPFIVDLPIINDDFP